MLPNFFVVGAQKAATTSLHHYLSSHPEIYLPKQKETHFFVRDSLYEKGINYYEKEYYSNYDGQVRVGEIDPEYMYFPIALDRMDNDMDISRVKFIFIFRNPVDRAFSQYQMSVRRAIEDLSFEEAMLQEKERIAKGVYEQEHYSYVTRGEYIDQVMRFLDRVDKKNILFLLSEDLLDDRGGALRKIYEFLDVDKEFIPDDINKSFHKATVSKSRLLTSIIKGNGKLTFSLIRPFIKLLVPKLVWRNKIKEFILSLNSKPSDLKFNPDTRKELQSYYYSYNKRLADVIGRDLSHWND